MKTGEGKTFVAVQPLYLNGLDRARRPPRHRQRLPREARRGVDAAASTSCSGARSATSRTRCPSRAARGVRLRRRVRDELRVRLRLPARQHGRLARRRRPAQPLVRDRGRGRLDPRRRGAHAAHHLGRARDRRRDVLPVRSRGERPSTASLPRARRPRGSTRPSSRAPTSSTTRSSRPSRRRRPRSRRSSARSGSTTSTTRGTSSSSTI